ncbi:YiiD C-terminal domain-containing protein [Lentisalinibacter salinarum]|uniref:YiiD C-terminal domain-containing protein n=1 Tax=Lentisalinibacter salinarum TaxID=2992239 RepID=UPI00386438DC
MSRLERYLHETIPLTVAMGVGVRSEDPERVVLAAPLAPNINHKQTAFGGSVAALATLAAWSLAQLRAWQAGDGITLVIRDSRMEYLRPVTAELVAVCEFDDDAAWQRALAQLRRRGRARLELASRLESAADGTAARFHGTFVLLAGDGR